MRYLLFSGEEKRSKKVACDYYRGCVPDPATLFWVSEFIKACFLIVWKGVCFMYVIFFFQTKKKEAKRHRDTCGCVPDPATL